MKVYITQEENLVNGAPAANITDGTLTEVIAAQGTNIRTYISEITLTNSHATTGTVVKIMNGSTVVRRVYARYEGGAVMKFPSPLRGAANTAWNVQCETAGAEVQAAMSGFKQKEG